MIELKIDVLHFSFPEIHPQARFNIELIKTLRVPDDGKKYPLPAGLGRFPLRHVDDYAARVHQDWLVQGGVMLPIYKSEALWLLFKSDYIVDQAPYPFAVRVLTGKVDAITGEEYEPGLCSKPQNYLVSPEQPWLDGYCVGKGVVRQFVAASVGEGYTAEEQITGLGQYGGIQIIVYPMKRDVFERRFPREIRRTKRCSSPGVFMHRTRQASIGMGVAPGGTINQEVYEDRFDLDDWDQNNSSRCYVHMLDSIHWKHVTGEAVPSRPITSKQYEKSGIPWFDYYGADAEALDSQTPLEQLLSLGTLMKSWTGEKITDNKSIEINNVKMLGSKPRKKGQVREGIF